ncbi:proline dehydrogenase family protein [Paenibacillus sp. J5C_2022]|uniref:proline dehydrogenase family protein n=1 Tax=Paenibacillus sp. J5C2022 TaxID=2977129 RepID=UPI0021D09571|nr:proline dehydrogenase family protein [Paenibacillus sp. J5C2022]MCU6707294.1 proline dehydrogenase family protein [Paenibacillus sp. J5C2022]
MHTYTQLEREFADALKSVARRQDIKSYIESNPLLQSLLWRSAKQYVTGGLREDGVAVAERLVERGYAVSLEYIGENTTLHEHCEAAATELLTLVEGLGEKRIPSRVSFDLSHIGLMIDPSYTVAQLCRLAEAAQAYGIELFISMEESAKTDRILEVYSKACKQYANIGITLQAQLHRTSEDVCTKLPVNALLRIVKGAYQEAEEIALPRSMALNERYKSLVRQAVRSGHRVSVATHDEGLLDQLMEAGLLSADNVEIEMLYGIRPELSMKWRDDGYPVRIYLTYGHEWYLYLCHRIAEHPPNLYKALIAMLGEDAEDSVLAYE